MDIKRLLENYISDIDLILDYNNQFGGADEDYYNQLRKSLNDELDKVSKNESTSRYGGVNDKS